MRGVQAEAPGVRGENAAFQSGLNEAASAGRKTTPSARLAKAAHSFEAALAGELLKPMQQDGLFLGGEGAGSTDALRGFGLEAMAQAISERGGLGIAQSVLERLAPLEKNPLGPVQP